VATVWAYQDFPAGTNEEAALNKILDDAWARDLKQLSNQDADYNPRVDAWANGTDVTTELDRMMKVRRAALTRFGENVIRKADPVALVEEALVPLYLHHRYQVEAVASAIGGLSYHYALRGDGRTPWTFVPAADQRAALDGLMRTLVPSELTVPDHILKLLPPRPEGFARHRELFPRNTGLPFDAMTPAMVAADLTVSFVLRPERAARLVNQKALDPSLPGLGEVIDRLIQAGFDQKAATGYEAEIARVVGRVVAERLMALAGGAPSAQVRAISSLKLDVLRTRLKGLQTQDAEAWAHAKLVADDITRFLDRPAESYKSIAPTPAPPGAPIGDPDLWWIDASPVAGSAWWTWLMEEFRGW
jgi:hypothetical protein